jgi:hypothetical protein
MGNGLWATGATYGLWAFAALLLFFGGQSLRYCFFLAGNLHLCTCLLITPTTS